MKTFVFTADERFSPADQVRERKERQEWEARCWAFRVAEEAATRARVEAAAIGPRREFEMRDEIAHHRAQVRAYWGQS